jgi:hypothetical protein
MTSMNDEEAIAALVTLVVLSLIISGILAMIALYFAARWMDSFEEKARAASGKEELPLRDIPKQLTLFRDELAAWTSDYRRLQRENADLRVRLDTQQKQLTAGGSAMLGESAAPREASGPEAQLANAGRAAITEAKIYFGRLAADQDFKSLDRELEVSKWLATADALLAQVASGKSAGAAELTKALRDGELDTVLTLAGFLDAYFPMEDNWYGAGRAVAALEALIRSILAREEIEIYAVRPLSRLASHHEGAKVIDHRNVRDIERVHRAVAQQATHVSGKDLLVIDCWAPGWVMASGDSLPPRLSLYNQADWMD